MAKEIFPILSIAGSDSCGGAGIQTDIRTIWELGGYPMTAVTAVTAQNTQEVADSLPISPKMVVQQIETTVRDIPPMAIKTGMLCNSDIIKSVASVLAKIKAPLVLDPVMVSTSGFNLIGDEAVEVMIQRLFPLATLITPNYREAYRLTGTYDLKQQVSKLQNQGCQNILIKGGDAPTDGIKTDYLILENSEIKTFHHETVDTKNTHGTGCTLSAAIAAFLGRGFPLEQAVNLSINFVHNALEAGKEVVLGRGHGPCLTLKPN